MHPSPVGNPLDSLKQGTLFQLAEDLPPWAPSDVLATVDGNDLVEPPAVDRAKRSCPDPTLEIELQPIVRRLDNLQAHACAETPEQGPVLLSPEILGRRQGRGLGFNELREDEGRTENAQDPCNPDTPGTESHLTETILDRRC